MLLCVCVCPFPLQPLQLTVTILLLLLTTNSISCVISGCWFRDVCFFFFLKYFVILSLVSHYFQPSPRYSLPSSALCVLFPVKPSSLSPFSLFTCIVSVSFLLSPSCLLHSSLYNKPFSSSTYALNPSSRPAIRS